MELNYTICHGFNCVFQTFCPLLSLTYAGSTEFVLNVTVVIVVGGWVHFACGSDLPNEIIII